MAILLRLNEESERFISSFRISTPDCTVFCVSLEKTVMTLKCLNANFLTKVPFLGQITP